MTDGTKIKQEQIDTLVFNLSGINNRLDSLKEFFKDTALVKALVITGIEKKKGGLNQIRKKTP